MSEVFLIHGKFFFKVTIIIKEYNKNIVSLSLGCITTDAQSNLLSTFMHFPNILL